MITHFNNLVEEFDTLIIGYSGGVDSQVLLHLAAATDKKVIAAHVNHNINENSNHWVAFCHEQCRNLGVEFFSKSINLTSGNLENEARNLRYSFFKDLASEFKPETTALLTGHHCNDLVENFFLKLVRGSGIDALSSIQEKTFRNGMNIIRPLLPYKKLDIIDFANSSSLYWVEDPSNKESEYDRNFVRNEIIPLFENRWKNTVSNIYKSTLFINEANKYIKESINLYDYMINESLDSKKMLSLSEFEKKYIIREWFKKIVEMTPDANLVNSIIEQCIMKKPHNSGKIIKKFFVVEKNKHLISINFK